MNIVQDIQRPQAASEHTVEPVGMSQAQEISSIGGAISGTLDFGARVLSGSESKKDLGPLARALQTYVDDTTGNSTTQASQIRKYQAIVRWALSNGYDNHDISSTAESLGANIPWEAAKSYITEQNRIATLEDVELTKRAERRYPGMNLTEAKALIKESDINDLQVAFGGEAQKALGLTGEMTYAEHQGRLLQYISNKLQDEYAAKQDTMMSDTLTDSLYNIGKELVKLGYSSELVNYYTNLAYAVWEPTTKDNMAKATNYNASLDQREKEYKHNKNMREIRESIYKYDRKWALMNTKINYKDGKSFRLGDVVIVDDFSPNLAVAMWDHIIASGGSVDTIFNSLAEAVSNKELSDVNTNMIMSTHYTDLVNSSPNDTTRANGAKSQGVAGSRWIDSASKDHNLKAHHVLERYNRTYTLDAKDYQGNVEQISINRDNTDAFIKTSAEKFGLDLNNSIPLFDSNGNIRLFEVTSPKPFTGTVTATAAGLEPYRVQDITSGYSFASDRRLFDEYFSKQIPLFIARASNTTGLSEKELKNRWNDIVIANSDVGKRMARGEDIRNRWISGQSPINESAELNADEISKVKGMIFKGEPLRPMEFGTGSLDWSKEFKDTRGMRNNNPTNIEKNPKNKWQGARKEQTDKRFVQFETPEDGIRAAYKVLQSYSKRGVDTIAEIAQEWSNTSGQEYDNYKSILRDFTGLSDSDKVNVKDKAMATRLIKGIVFAENAGRQPYGDSLYARALGVTKPVSVSSESVEYSTDVPEQSSSNRSFFSIPVGDALAGAGKEMLKGASKVTGAIKNVPGVRKTYETAANVRDFFNEVLNVTSKGYKGAVDVSEKALDKILFNTSKEDLVDIVYNVGESIKTNVNEGAEAFINYLEGPLYKIVDDGIKAIIPSKDGNKTVSVEEEDLREKAKEKILSALKSGDYSEIPLIRILQREEDDGSYDVLVEKATIEDEIPLFSEELDSSPIIAQTSKGFVILPSVYHGVKLSDEEALRLYNEEGKHYGIYRSLDAAFRHAGVDI